MMTDTYDGVKSEEVTLSVVTMVHSSDNLLLSEEGTEVMTRMNDCVKTENLSTPSDKKSVDIDEVDSSLGDLLIAGKRTVDAVGVVCDAILTKNNTLRQRNARRKKIASALGELLMMIASLAVVLNSFNKQYCFHDDCVKFVSEVLHNGSFSPSENISTLDVSNKIRISDNTEWIDPTQQFTYA